MRIWSKIWVSATKSFKLKLIVSLTCILMLASGTAGYLTYQSNQRLFKEEMSKQVAITNREALTKLELKVQEMKRISQTIVFHKEIEEMIGRFNSYKDEDAFQLYLEKERIDELINQLKSDAPYITGLYMFNLTNGMIYYRYNTPVINALDEEALGHIRSKVTGTSGELVWMNMALPSGIEPDGFRHTIVATRLMKNNSIQPYGMLVITIDEQYLAGSLSELTKNNAGKVYLFNGEQLLYTNEKGLTAERLAEIRQLPASWASDDEVYARSKSSRAGTDGFELVNAKSMLEIQDKNRRIAEKIVIAGLISAVLASVLIALAAERLLRPLSDLLRGLKRLRDGKFETRIEVRSNDELAYIGDSFNAMAEHVEQLIKEVYMTQLSEREAELKALQAQLNPHFLYNFFNEVYWKLQAGGERDTAALIAAVSGLLRHSLMPVRTPTTVQEEVRQIRNYVKIQTELFETDLAFTIDADEQVMPYKVMRSLLQPLVENVFQHAFLSSLSHKTLHIRIVEEDCFLRFEIADNGCGMPQALIDELLHGDPGVMEEARIAATARRLRSQEQTARIAHAPADVSSDAAMGLEPSGGALSAASWQAGTDEDSSEERRDNLGVRSVSRRIELLYGAPYRLEIESELTKGTIMRLYLPKLTA
ncbi:histidine kinase [Paenibacillus algorifonticola]|uniref:cache domain-containing sensor histidine kinase n=1 Tax=Paenibacillus algorifonticola TaxID=684063 RepID=UPI003D2778DC